MAHERETLVGALGRRGLTGLETGCLGSQPLRRAWRSRVFCRPPRAGPPGQRWDGTAVCLGGHSDHKGAGWPEIHFSGKAIGGRLFFFFAVEGTAGCRCHRKGHRNVGVGLAGKAVLERGQGPVCSWAGRRMGGNRQGVCFRLDSRSLRAQGREVSSEVEVQA